MVWPLTSPHERPRDVADRGVWSCQFCSDPPRRTVYHDAPSCPRVRRVEFYADGLMKRIDFYDVSPRAIGTDNPVPGTEDGHGRNAGRARGAA